MHKTADEPKTAASYNKILDSANRLYDEGHHAQAIAILDAAKHQFKLLSVQQKAEYYIFHYNYRYHILHNNNTAILYADSLLKLFSSPLLKKKYSSYYSNGCFYKGDALFSEGRFNEAYLYFYQGKLMSGQNGKLHDCMLSDYSYRMGMILYQQEHYRLAAHFFKTSFDEAGACQLSFKSIYRQQELLNNAGISYKGAGELDSAGMYFSKALTFIDAKSKLFPNATNSWNVARAVIYGNQASMLLKQNKFTQAEGLLRKSIAINIKKGNDNKDALFSELKLAHIYLTKSQTDSLKSTLTFIKPLLDSINDTDANADWNILKAGYYEELGDLRQAIDYFKLYDAEKNRASKKSLALKETDISEQLRRFERDYELEGLKKINQQQNIYLAIAAAFAVVAISLLLLIYKYWRKSKINVYALHKLNQQINTQNVILESAMNDLELSSREKDRILRAVAHDLRNPVGGIASLSHAIADDEGYNEEQKSCLNLIKETAYNSIELINEILEATSNNSDRLVNQWVDINALVNNSVELLRFKAAEKNQQIVLTALDRPKELWISREKIWRVMSNLISNAIKFSPVGATIQVGVTELEEEIEFTVKDNGIGIPENLKPHVFNMFTEAKRPGTLGEKSFGLGLSICRQIIEKHHGQIWFESSTDKGTTFHVRLKKSKQEPLSDTTTNSNSINVENRDTSNPTV